MKTILYLVHRLPFPPNKGDKISSYNLLKFLSERYEIHLGCFVDLAEDWRYADNVRAVCADTCLVGLDPRWAKLASLRALISGEPLSVPYYRNRRLQQWVDRVVRRVKPHAILVYSGAMAQYVPVDGPRTVLTLDDVDSEKWRQYAATKPWPLSWLYKREADELLAFERRKTSESDACVFISSAEADLFRRLAPEVADKVVDRRQGVDGGYFDPAGEYPNPIPTGERALVFTGLMDYWPNVEAVTWFADAVLPLVRQERPQAQFMIVGMNPNAAVRRLGERPGITVTGAVPDVRPYLAHCAAVVAPLRIARGIQNKVLEALAMARPVVATEAALTGIDVGPNKLTRACNSADPAAMAAAIIEVLDAPGSDPAARETVLQHYNWDTNLKQMVKLLEGTAEE